MVPLFKWWILDRHQSIHSYSFNNCSKNWIQCSTLVVMTTEIKKTLKIQRARAKIFGMTHLYVYSKNVKYFLLKTERGRAQIFSMKYLYVGVYQVFLFLFKTCRLTLPHTRSQWFSLRCKNE
jgi:hypothetical protein